MDSEKIKKIEKSIENLKNKTAKIFFYLATPCSVKA
jgi:hypothetical protein